MTASGGEGPAGLAPALAAWERLLGVQHVRRDEAELARRGVTTLPRAPRPLAVIRPKSLEEVIGAIRIAAQNQIPVYPVSTGRNWGYGDACPVTEGQVLLDLARMNRIIEVNEELAYAVIEPGVTQGQLAAHLTAAGGRLMMDCTGAGPGTSIVGNVLERGFGHTAYGIRTSTISGMQVVLADGRVLETGFGHYAAAKAARVYPSGIGPSLDGLFMQSNFGVVTRLGLWLMPTPEELEMIVCIIERHEDVAPVVDALRRLRLAGTLRSVVHIANDLRLMSSAVAYPWADAGTTGLSRELREQLRREAGVGAWALSAGIAGCRAEVRAARRAVERALTGTGRKLLRVTERRLDFGEGALQVLPSSWMRGARRRLAAARSVMALNRGEPIANFLQGAYWRRRGGPPEVAADPARDGCGLIWLAPVLPMEGSAVLDFCRLVEPLYERNGFDPMLTLSTITDRALCAVMTIAYDKDSADETGRAERFRETLAAALTANGYISYRVGIDAMGELARGSAVFWDIAAGLKDVLDPLGIIAPGRYEPRRVRG